MPHETEHVVPPFLSRVGVRVPCTRHPWLFHPPDEGYDDRGRRGRQRSKEAVALCQTCPVIKACRQWARDQGEYGIWGGETDGQRMAVGSRSRVRGGCPESWEAAALDAAMVEERPGGARRVPVRAQSPALTPVEEQILVALHEGIDAGALHDELGRSHAAVTRALMGLQRKLGTGMDGLVDAARDAGLLQSRVDAAPDEGLLRPPYTPAA
ncbi:WhiB family transcriptional regulator [Streptomyces wedmorensis]|uniref:WhiB family transcriptional regulator n=1 Tax=Streptomyces wedmorensis TaxID=43759 RepID=UPI0037AD3B6F